MKADRMRLGFRLVTGAALLAVLGLTALLRFQDRREHNATVDQMQQQARQLALNNVQTRLELTAAMLADALVNPVYFFDLQNIEQVLSGALRQPDIAYAVVVDRHGRVLHDGRDQATTAAEWPEQAFAAVAAGSDAPLTQVSGDWMEATHPLLLGQERIGLLRLGLDLSVAHPVQPMLAPAMAFTRQDGMLLLGLAVALLMLAWWAERRLLAPVLSWRDRARALLSRDRSATDDAAGQEPVGAALRFAEHALTLAEAECQRQIFRDGLTGLPNRLALRQLLNERLRPGRQRPRELALLFIDLDEFKRINDTLGHDAGDEILVETGKRFGAVLRAQDASSECFMARLGGDEFIILLTCPSARQLAGRIAEKLLAVVRLPFRVSEQNLYLSTSIGITSYPEDADNAGQLLKNGDIALYLAKVHGRNCYRYFTPYLTELADDRLALEQDLREALVNDELEVFYQPIVHLDSGTICGAEALLRWNHRSRGQVSPSIFIAIAEDVGLIDVIGHLALRDALREASSWPLVDGTAPFIAVNLSVKQLRDVRFPQNVQNLLDETGLAPSRLHLEITESALLDDQPLAFAALETLNRLGTRLWLDDFGTGFSGLSHLRRVAVAGVKIDRSFTADLLSDRHDMALTSAIVAMARSLGIAAVAEGVETVAQIDSLRSLDCEFGQGYWFGQPMPAADFRALLDSQRAPRSAPAMPRDLAG